MVKEYGKKVNQVHKHLTRGNIKKIRRMVMGFLSGFLETYTKVILKMMSVMVKEL